MKFEDLCKKVPEVSIGESRFFYDEGVYISSQQKTSDCQKQTEETFGFKWKKEDTFDSRASTKRMRKWLFEKYNDPQDWLSLILNKNPLVLDAGCGAGLSGFEYWGGVMSRIRYLGVDISEACYVAAKRANEKKYNRAVFMRSNIDQLPFESPLFDLIFSEGVLHHTDSTKNSFKHLCKFLRPEGLFMFYIYRKKGPIREFTDDYIREKLQAISPEQAWKAIEPLSKLGIELGKLNVEIDVPESIDILGLPCGKINLQRFFYWHICKAFYDPSLTFDEMHHINFDWFAPKNAHRHTVDEVKDWCRTQKLEIQHMKEEISGITCVAKKRA
jgi:SAM-dependent methyltransferase